MWSGIGWTAFSSFSWGFLDRERFSLLCLCCILIFFCWLFWVKFTLRKAVNNSTTVHTKMKGLDFGSGEEKMMSDRWWQTSCATKCRITVNGPGKTQNATTAEVEAASDQAKPQHFTLLTCKYNGKGFVTCECRSSKSLFIFIICLSEIMIDDVIGLQRGVRVRRFLTFIFHYLQWTKSCCFLCPIATSQSTCPNWSAWLSYVCVVPGYSLGLKEGGGGA